ncbi:hypothetical protein GCM10027418_23020 [Mariniluteicoccus endophyticus]
MSSFWRDTDRSEVTVKEAIAEWSLYAWDVLEAVAGRYRRTLTTDDLGSEVQRRSQIHTSEPTSSWIAPVLGLVEARAREQGVPQLTSLVTDGAGRPIGHANEELATAARLECYRAYGAKIPVVSDEPAKPRARKVKNTGTPTKSTRDLPPPRKASVCPTCHLEMPATGICDDCD